MSIAALFGQAAIVVATSFAIADSQITPSCPLAAIFFNSHAGQLFIADQRQHLNNLICTLLKVRLA
jgi:hypothetical protein